MSYHELPRARRVGKGCKVIILQRAVPAPFLFRGQDSKGLKPVMGCVERGRQGRRQLAENGKGWIGCFEASAVEAWLYGPEERGRRELGLSQHPRRPPTRKRGVAQWHRSGGDAQGVGRCFERLGNLGAWWGAA